jgi:hypothetical protein
MSTVKKQIKDFVLDNSPAGDSQLLLQTASGTTKKTTKDAFLNDVNTSLIGLQSQIDNLDLNYATESSLVAISGNLQTQIDNFEVFSNAYYGQIKGVVDVSIGESEVLISHDYIINPIPVVSLIIPDSDSILFVSGIKNINNENFTVLLSSSVPISGYKISWHILDDHPERELVYTSTLTSISGALQDQFDNLELNYATDASLIAISGNLQTQINNINTSIFSSFDCVIGEQYYNVVYESALTNPMPVISLVIPSISDVFLMAIIYNSTSNGFSVALSQAPTKNGYKINWSVNS